MKIALNNNKGFSWFQNNNLYIKGYFFDEENIFYEKEKMLDFFEKINSETQFLNALKKLNGCFSIIFKVEDSFIITSDTTRVFPLFYNIKNNIFSITDDVFKLKDSININDFDDLASIEFKATNHTHGKKTLLKNVYQIQSNELIKVKNNEIIRREFLFSYSVKNSKNSNYNTLKIAAISNFENSFKRLINSLQNKTVIVPLSGGFDSRLITIMLKKFNYKNVICYTYGNKNSHEIKNSKATAKQLGFTWYFIDYNRKLTENYTCKEDFKKYVHYAGKLSSMPNLQEYFAVKHLTENNLIPRNSIFIPGYAGDILGGSEFLNTIPLKIKNDSLVDEILNKKFTNHPLSKRNKYDLKVEIKKTLLEFDHNYQDKITSSVFEDYNIKERIAKFIFNSTNFYTFFEHEFRVPFWDKSLLHFFRKVPVEFKKMKLLFNDVLIEEYFKPYNVYFEEELQPTIKNIYLQKIKDAVKPFFPTFIKQNFLIKNDWINYKPITNELFQSLKKNQLKIIRKSNSYNEIITQWYLYFSKNKIK